MNEFFSGKVKWYNREKGFGFIRMDNGEDVFVHRSDVGALELDEGTPVRFAMGQGPRGQKAVNIEITQ